MDVRSMVGASINEVPGGAGDMERADEREIANRTLMRAKMLMSVCKTTEAESALAEAETAFRRHDDNEMLSEVFISRSQIRLCQGQVPEALADIDEAFRIWQGIGNPAKKGQLLFYRGLAYLAMGKEEEAHRDLDEFVALSEGLNDYHAQFLGHFYHALVYERRGEPCMASAELEIGKDAVPDFNSSRKGRMDAFLAHLWLRRGELNEAKDLESETLSLILVDADKAGPANLGMAFLVRAEILATRSEWEESMETFERAIEVFRITRYGLYYEALAHSWYGETLICSGKTEEGCRNLMKSRAIYERLSNETQVKKIDARIAESGCSRTFMGEASNA
jgi:tetratricopeptide (TPR) repeat protein